jgi:hypothetical protein
MVAFTGLSSVWNRIVFTDKGPIVKRPLSVLSGANLRILSETSVNIPTANFVDSHIGYNIVISGSPSFRNDGSFTIEEIIDSTTVKLQKTNFDISDVALTLALVMALTNDVRNEYNKHLTQTGVHGTDDAVNIANVLTVTNLGQTLTVLNDLKSKFNSHAILITGTVPTHIYSDADNIVTIQDAVSLSGAILLANEIREKYENHRKNRYTHLDDDAINVVSTPRVSVVTNIYPGLLTGPFSWVLQNPLLGMTADDPTDVTVRVNGIVASVDMVFGLLGAVVLSNKPNPGDVVTIDYNWIANPPARLLRLNSPEFCLNQDGNNNLCGYPQHRYRSRSYLIDPGNTPDFASAFQPRKTGWKYKGYERAYTSSLNDPTTLLSNVPINKLTFPVLSQKISDDIIRYFPTALPQNVSDPWVLNGVGLISTNSSELTIVDSNIQTGTSSLPPFFSHSIDVATDSVISSAFRTVVDEYELYGVTTGVSFGISNGEKAIITSFIITDAINLSSSIIMLNDIRKKFEAHLLNIGSHDPNDISSYISVVDATDLTSLVILANELKSVFNAHIAKGSGIGLTHKLADAVNTIVSADANNLLSAMVLINDARLKFNAHATQTGVHFVDDVLNNVSQVKQIGILTNRGFQEFQDSWDAYAVDWTEYVSYRMYIDPSGDVSLYLSASVLPVIQTVSSNLPRISDIDGKFDPVQQIFFGSIGKGSKSTSRWQFVYMNLVPVDANLIGDNKSVDYSATVVPELDPTNPWITVGQGGNERILSGGGLLLDSTSSASDAEVASLGLSSGAYRGFVRFEPILSVNTASSIEFQSSIDYFTFGIDNKSVGLFVDDKDFSVQLSFIQYSPSAATTLGAGHELFPMTATDNLVLRINGGPEISVIFAIADTLASDVSNKINAFVGFAFASAHDGKVKLTSSNLGSTATFEIVRGSSLSKLGFSPGIYCGFDSTPEPKVSWFGANSPDFETPKWVAHGTQLSAMHGRTLRITDSSVTDYLVYAMSDALVTTPSFGPSENWKLDSRLIVESFTIGDWVPVPPGPFMSLRFAGAVISINEGAGGKNVDLQLCIDPVTGDQYINLVTYDILTDLLIVVAQYAFSWNDNAVHSYNIYTSKAADGIYIYADGVLLASVGPALLYSNLSSGFSFPSITFGSGGNPVTNSDLSASNSVVDWESVAIFRDSKIDDPTASSRRYVGIYSGGDTSLLSSYYLHQIDWSSTHTYRMVRDPMNALSIYVDGGSVPVISVPYDVLRLPPTSSSFISPIAHDRQTVSFGSFSPEEISRSRWSYVRYSIGKITLNDRVIIPRQALNQSNIVASYEHMKTQERHSHFGFKVYSSGTPIDDFMADETVPASTELYEDTVPVPMTQNLESRGGLIKTGTQLSSISSISLVNTRGFITDLEDDTTNIMSSSIAIDINTSIAILNDFRTKYLLHVIQYRVHLANDDTNVILPIEASDFTSAVDLANASKTMFNQHISGTIRETQKIHTNDDIVNTVISADASSLITLMALTNEIRTKYEAHRIRSGVHGSSLFIRIDPPSGVLYERMKFWQNSDGDSGRLHPFSDDETWWSDGIKMNTTVQFNYNGSALPENLNPGWSLIENGPGNSTISLTTIGPTDVLRYGTAGAGIETVYHNTTQLPSTLQNFDLKIRLKVNSFPAGTDFDSGIRAGFISQVGPGIAAAIGLDAIGNIPYVTIQDIGSEETMHRTPFNWGDGNFHTFRLVYDASTDTVGLIIDE